MILGKTGLNSHLVHTDTEEKLKILFDMDHGNKIKPVWFCVEVLSL